MSRTRVQTDVAELYLVDLATPGTSTKLNPPRQGLLISQIEFAASEPQIYYHADQDTANTHELYRINLASAGVATKVSGALPADNNVVIFAIEPGFPF